MPSGLQGGQRVFKKTYGKGELNITSSSSPATEILSGFSYVINNRIWVDSEKIPRIRPTFTYNRQIIGVVQFISGLTLKPHTYTNAFYHEDLIDAIPLYWGDGSYNPSVYSSGVTGLYNINTGGDWWIDSDIGGLTFYGVVPQTPNTITISNPPRVSFYKYVGDKGIASPGLNIKSGATLASTILISNYNNTLSGFTSIPVTIDGIDTTTLSNGTRVLVKDQTNTWENGIYQINTVTSQLLRADDANQIGEVSVNDYIFIESGLTNMASSWVLSASDANASRLINPGVHTQRWVLFSHGVSYSSDGKSIKLTGTTFGLQLNEDGSIFGSGLYQDVNGLKISDELEGIVTGHTIDITSLSTSIYSEIETRRGNVESLSTSLYSLLSTETSERISGDESLYTLLSIETSERISSDDSLSTTIAIIPIIGAGSGLTYDVLEQNLNVNVDETTITISGNTLKGLQLEIQTTTNITLTTDGPIPDFIFTHMPVAYVSGYINGVEYLFYSGVTSITDYPFYYGDYPPNEGTTICFNPVESGFDINTDDIINVKYLRF